MERLTILTRELTPFEHLVAGHLCDGLSNAAIARETSHSEKVVENTVSRLAKALGIISAPEINTRDLSPSPIGRILGMARSTNWVSLVNT